MVNQLLSSTLVACGGPQHRLFATTSFLKTGGDGFRILREEDCIELKTKIGNFWSKLTAKSDSVWIYVSLTWPKFGHQTQQTNFSEHGPDQIYFDHYGLVWLRKFSVLWTGPKFPHRWSAQPWSEFQTLKRSLKVIWSANDFNGISNSADIKWCRTWPSSFDIKWRRVIHNGPISLYMFVHKSIMWTGFSWWFYTQEMQVQVWNKDSLAKEIIAHHTFLFRALVSCA